MRCKKGHERTEENTYHDPRGWMVCRVCASNSAAVRVAREKRASLPLIEYPEWMDHAACRNTDPELFFNAPAAARRICDRCPVIEHCMRYAARLRMEEPLYGIWAGRRWDSRAQAAVIVNAP